MKITDVRSLYLEGPRNHMPGGGAGVARKLGIRESTTASPMGQPGLGCGVAGGDEARPASEAGA